MSRHDVLADPRWVADRLQDPALRVLEVDRDFSNYRSGHLPGAIGLDWTGDLQAGGTTDVLDAEAFGHLLGARGVGNEHVIVLYGDHDNWHAGATLWYLRYYGHHAVKLLAGGRDRWIAEGLPLTTALPTHPPRRFHTAPGDDRFARDYDDGSSDGWGAFGSGAAS